MFRPCGIMDLFPHAFEWTCRVHCASDPDPTGPLQHRNPDRASPPPSRGATANPGFTPNLNPRQVDQKFAEQQQQIAALKADNAKQREEIAALKNERSRPRGSVAAGRRAGG